MPIQRRLLIAVADGEHARFVRPGADNVLHEVSALDSQSAHQRASDIGSDHPGASYHTGSTAHHGLSPRHDPHDLAKQGFARSVADALNASCARGEFDDLVLVAPSHILQVIRDHLDGDATSRVIGTLAKDLVKTPDDALWPHVRDWVDPAHRPVT